MHSQKDIVAMITLAVLSSLPARAQGMPYPPGVLGNARQAIVVTTADWNAVDGKLIRYERRGSGWKQVEQPIPVVVGSNGLAWGHDLAAGQNGHAKHEGDGRSPAGVFPVSQLFGFAPTSPNARMPYLQLTNSTECVDDVNSGQYAHIADATAVAKDWNSSEQMRQIEQYRDGAVVDYNMSPTTKAAGSCIFLHIWKGPGQGTAGCTAMDAHELETVLRWLDSSQHPVLIQLPKSEYQRLRAEWQLP